MAKKSSKIINYFKEVKSELKKVVWPSFKQVKNNTLIVLACVLFIGIVIWVADLVFDISLGKIVKNAQNENAQVTEQTTDTDANSNEESMSEEDTLKLLQQYYAQAGINFDGTKYTDSKTGAELTQEQVDEKMKPFNEAAEQGAETTDDAQKTESTDKN